MHDHQLVSEWPPDVHKEVAISVSVAKARDRDRCRWALLRGVLEPLTANAPAVLLLEHETLKSGQRAWLCSMFNGF